MGRNLLSGFKTNTTIDVTTPLYELMRRAGFSHQNPRIDDTKYPSIATACISMDLLLLCLAEEQAATTQQVLEAVAFSGFVPAGLRETIAFVAANPNLRLMPFDIYSLGAIRRDPGGMDDVLTCSLRGERLLRAIPIHKEPFWQRDLCLFLCLAPD